VHGSAVELPILLLASLPRRGCSGVDSYSQLHILSLQAFLLVRVSVPAGSALQDMVDGCLPGHGLDIHILFSCSCCFTQYSPSEVLLVADDSSNIHLSSYVACCFGEFFLVALSNCSSGIDCGHARCSWPAHTPREIGYGQGYTSKLFYCSLLYVWDMACAFTSAQIITTLLSYVVFWLGFRASCMAHNALDTMAGLIQ